MEGSIQDNGTDASLHVMKEARDAEGNVIYYLADKSPEKTPPQPAKIGDRHVPSPGSSKAVLKLSQSTTTQEKSSSSASSQPSTTVLTAPSIAAMTAPVPSFSADSSVNTAFPVSDHQDGSRKTQLPSGSSQSGNQPFHSFSTGSTLSSRPLQPKQPSMQTGSLAPMVHNGFSQNTSQVLVQNVSSQIPAPTNTELSLDSSKQLLPSSVGPQTSSSLSQGMVVNIPQTQSSTIGPQQGLPVVQRQNVLNTTPQASTSTGAPMAKPTQPLNVPTLPSASYNASAQSTVFGSTAQTFQVSSTAGTQNYQLQQLPLTNLAPYQTSCVQSQLVPGISAGNASSQIVPSSQSDVPPPNLAPFNIASMTSHSGNSYPFNLPVSVQQQQQNQTPSVPSETSVERLLIANKLHGDNQDPLAMDTSHLLNNLNVESVDVLHQMLESYSEAELKTPEKNSQDSTSSSSQPHQLVEMIPDQQYQSGVNPSRQILTYTASSGAAIGSTIHIPEVSMPYSQLQTPVSLRGCIPSTGMSITSNDRLNPSSGPSSQVYNASTTTVGSNVVTVTDMTNFILPNNANQYLDLNLTIVHDDPANTVLKESLMMPRKQVNSIQKTISLYWPDFSTYPAKCNCTSRNGNEIPVEQLWTHENQLFFLPQICVITIGNQELVGIEREYTEDGRKFKTVYVSVGQIFLHLLPELRKEIENYLVTKECDRAFLSLEEMAFLQQRKCININSATIISLKSLREMCTALIERKSFVDSPTINLFEAANETYYRKVLFKNTRCSVCGGGIREQTDPDEYELLDSPRLHSMNKTMREAYQSLIDKRIEERKKNLENVQGAFTQSKDGNKITKEMKVGTIVAGHMMFNVFVMGGKTYISIRELVMHRVMTIQGIQNRLVELKYKPRPAPSTVDLYFISENIDVENTLWIDTQTLRCICCMKMAAPPRYWNMEVYNRLKLNQYSFHEDASFLGEDDCAWEGVVYTLNTYSFKIATAKSLNKSIVSLPPKSFSDKEKHIPKRVRSKFGGFFGKINKAAPGKNVDELLNAAGGSRRNKVIAKKEAGEPMCMNFKDILKPGCYVFKDKESIKKFLLSSLSPKKKDGAEAKAKSQEGVVQILDLGYKSSDESEKSPQKKESFEVERKRRNSKEDCQETVGNKVSEKGSTEREKSAKKKKKKSVPITEENAHKVKINIKPAAKPYEFSCKSADDKSNLKGKTNSLTSPSAKKEKTLLSPKLPQHGLVSPGGKEDVSAKNQSDVEGKKKVMEKEKGKKVRAKRNKPKLTATDIYDWSSEVDIGDENDGSNFEKKPRHCKKMKSEEKDVAQKSKETIPQSPLTMEKELLISIAKLKEIENLDTDSEYRFSVEKDGDTYRITSSSELDMELAHTGETTNSMEADRVEAEEESSMETDRDRKEINHDYDGSSKVKTTVLEKLEEPQSVEKQMSVEMREDSPTYLNMSQGSDDHSDLEECDETSTYEYYSPPCLEKGRGKGEEEVLGAALALGPDQNVIMTQDQLSLKEMNSGSVKENQGSELKQNVKDETCSRRKETFPNSSEDNTSFSADQTGNGCVNEIQTSTAMCSENINIAEALASEQAQHHVGRAKIRPRRIKSSSKKLSERDFKEDKTNIVRHSDDLECILQSPKAKELESPSGKSLRKHSRRQHIKNKGDISSNQMTGAIHNEVESMQECTTMTAKGDADSTRIVTDLDSRMGSTSISSSTTTPASGDADMTSVISESIPTNSDSEEEEDVDLDYLIENPKEGTVLVKDILGVLDKCVDYNGNYNGPLEVSDFTLTADAAEVFPGLSDGDISKDQLLKMMVEAYGAVHRMVENKLSSPSCSESEMSAQRLLSAEKSLEDDEEVSFSAHEGKPEMIKADDQCGEDLQEFNIEISGRVGGSSESPEQRDDSVVENTDGSIETDPSATPPMTRDYLQSLGLIESSQLSYFTSPIRKLRDRQALLNLQPLKMDGEGKKGGKKKRKRHVVVKKVGRNNSKKDRRLSGLSRRKPMHVRGRRYHQLASLKRIQYSVTTKSGKGMKELKHLLGEVSPKSRKLRSGAAIRSSPGKGKKKIKTRPKVTANKEQVLNDSEGKTEGLKDGNIQTLVSGRKYPMVVLSRTEVAGQSSAKTGEGGDQSVQQRENKKGGTCSRNKGRSRGRSGRFVQEDQGGVEGNLEGRLEGKSREGSSSLQRKTRQQGVIDRGLEEDSKGEQRSRTESASQERKTRKHSRIVGHTGEEKGEKNGDGASRRKGAEIGGSERNQRQHSDSKDGSGQTDGEGKVDRVIRSQSNSPIKQTRQQNRETGLKETIQNHVMRQKVNDSGEGQGKESSSQRFGNREYITCEGEKNSPGDHLKRNTEQGSPNEQTSDSQEKLGRNAIRIGHTSKSPEILQGLGDSGKSTSPTGDGKRKLSEVISAREAKRRRKLGLD